MSCERLASAPEWEQRIALYAGGDLGLNDAAEMKRHIAECVECAAVAEAHRMQIQVLAAAHADPIAPAHYSAVRARVLAEVERQGGRDWRWAWMGAVAAAVLIAMVLFPRGVRAPKLQNSGNTASAGVGGETRSSPAEGGDGTLKRAPRGDGGDVASNRAGMRPVEPARAPLSYGGGSQNGQRPAASRERQRAVGQPALETASIAASEPRPSADHVQSVAQAAKEPLVIKLFTDDPDVVIYWIAEGEGDSQ